LVVTIRLHTGGGGRFLQRTLTAAGALDPLALAATTVYASVPATEAVVSQRPLLLVQPVQV
jgi:hypothetical protein